MDPRNNNQTGIDLPQPAAPYQAQPQDTAGLQTAAGQSPSMSAPPVPPAILPFGPVAQASAPQVDDRKSSPSSATSSSASSATPPAASWLPPTVPVKPPAQAGRPLKAMPAAAEDTDLIEPEWVANVKEIVARTRQDPFAQTRELGRLKSEYLKKRYNKSVDAADGDS